MARRVDRQLLRRLVVEAHGAGAYVGHARRANGGWIIEARDASEKIVATADALTQQHAYQVLAGTLRVQAERKRGAA